MMERLREGVNSIAVKIILGLIILSFVFAGVGSYIVGGNANVAATVGNVDIARGEFEQAYQNERNRLQAQNSDYFNALLGDPTYVEQLRRSVLQRMVNQALLEQQADELGLRISDQQVRDLIVTMPQFQNNGRFDQEVYQSFLRRAGFTPDSFAEYLRRDMVRAQLAGALANTDFVLPSEIAITSGLISQTRDIRTLEIDVNQLAETVDINDEQIQQYYDDNAQRFTRPEQYRISYVELSAQQLQEEFAPTDDEVEDYYQDNLSSFSTEEQRQVAHILIQGDDEATAQSILDELNAGADFAQLAEDKSQDLGSAEEGGDLGWIEKGVMDPAFEDAAFALTAVGDMTGLVKSDFGYHIIKLNALKEPQAKPLAEIKDELKAELSGQRAVDEFYSLLTELETVAFEFPDSLDDAATAIGADVTTTDFVSAYELPELLRNQEISNALTSEEVKFDGLNSEVIEVGSEHVVVVRIEEAREQTVLPLEDVKADVESQLMFTLAREQADALALEVIDALSAGDETILADNNLSFNDVSTVDRGSEFADVVFAMPRPTEQSQFAQTQSLIGNVVVVELSKVNDVISSDFNQQIEAQLSQTFQGQEQQGLVSQLAETTEIEYFIGE
ncbi:peptidylprolyl isomerase [Vibrio ulleungensis]|uniref:Periplasmic chaperone PpiD n=1 Tax=Vibrio ulleungensis TaxID=2807619 RepID=A0ABS2HFN0_9VIBR|nr:peptidylprolyl isomerase [Vibrio ulleungensis]MBM7036355.1 peptidylprolyl isomerase [Vibrio ulleungensis]